MRIKWLGWAGVEIEAHDERVVIDPLADPGAVFAALGERAAAIRVPEIVSAQPGALAGMITHLHRDHADAVALTAALAPGAPVYEPVGYGGTGVEQLAIAQADHELSAAGVSRAPTEPWSSVRPGRSRSPPCRRSTAPGDPQVSWLVEADDTRVLHLGDTLFHGWWWRITERYGAPDVVLAPINGARLTFPHRRPASPFPGAMDPEQAAVAAELLHAEQLVPIHFGGYDLPGLYEPVPDALERLTAASNRVRIVALGDQIDILAASAPASPRRGAGDAERRATQDHDRGRPDPARHATNDQTARARTEHE